MKVLHFYSSNPNKINGIEVAISGLQKALLEKRTESFIFNIFSKNKLRIIINSIKKIKEIRPEIIVFHSLYHVEYIFIYFYISFFCNIPYLILFHGGASKRNYQKNKSRKFIANFLFFNRFVRGAKKVIYFNEFDKNNSIFNQINSSYIIIPNGIDNINVFKKKYVGKISFLFFSRLDVWGKGLDLLKEPIKRIKKEFNDQVEFIFCGPLEAGAEDFIDSMKDFIEYRGEVGKEKKESVFRSCDIMILPSRSEGMPMTILEAFSYGMPVLISNETNMGEVVKKYRCGWITALDRESIYQTFCKAIKDYEVVNEEMRRNSYLAARQYLWTEISETVIELFNGVSNSIK